LGSFKAVRIKLVISFQGSTLLSQPL